MAVYLSHAMFNNDFLSNALQYHFKFNHRYALMKKSLIAKRHQSNQLHDLSAFTNSSSGNLINLSIGDPDFHTPVAITETAFADAKAGHTHYTDGLGQRELREAVCNDIVSQGINTTVEHCMITTSACHGMWLLLEAILDEEDEVIVFSPYFSPYIEQIRLARGVAVDCPSDADNGFRIDCEQLVNHISDKTKAIIINTPNNPAGVCYSREDLLAIADVAKAHDLWVIADDIYTAFCYQHDHVAMASLPDMAERTITLGSFSKNYAMTGWRIGYIIAPPALIGVMESINQSVIFSPPTISQRAALHAIRLKAEVQPALVNTVKERAYAAYRGLNQLKGVRCLEPQGGMYVFPDIRGTGLDDVAFARYLMENAEIRVIAGSMFGQAGAGHIRIALTVSETTLEQAFSRLHALSLFQ